MFVTEMKLFEIVFAGDKKDKVGKTRLAVF